MKRALIARLERLEARPEIGTPQFFRYGWLHPLPDSYTGERHVVMVKREPTESPLIERCEFEERPGPAPAALMDAGPVIYLTRGETSGPVEG